MLHVDRYVILASQAISIDRTRLVIKGRLSNITPFSNTMNLCESIKPIKSKIIYETYNENHNDLLNISPSITDIICGSHTP